MWINLIGIIVCIWYLIGFIGWGFDRGWDYKYDFELEISALLKIWVIFVYMVLGGIVCYWIRREKRYKFGWRVW